MIFGNRISNRLQLCLFSSENEVFAVITNNWSVRWNLHYIQAVDLLEFFCFRKGRTCHSGQFLVQAEIVLERNGRERHAFLQDRNTFFGFNRLV